MKLRRIDKTSATEIELPSGKMVLFSYGTLVAIHVPGKGFYCTSKKWSRTTSKHINQWIARHGGSGEAFPIEQSELDKYAESNFAATNLPAGA